MYYDIKCIIQMTNTHFDWSIKYTQENFRVIRVGIFNYIINKPPFFLLNHLQF